MSKFKNAIDQINKPIADMAKQQEELKKTVNTDKIAGIDVKQAETEPAVADIPKTEFTENTDTPASENIDNKSKSKKEKADKKKEKADKKKEKKPKVKKIKKEKAPKKKKEVKRTVKFKVTLITAIVLIFLILVGSAANYNLNNQLKPTFYQLQSDKVVDNVRVVAIADMHLKEFGDNNVKLVEKVKSYHPDIIAIAGDMNIEDNPDYSVVLNLCARLNEIAPVYYSLGNHEIDAMLFKDSQIYYDLKSIGVNILNNEKDTIEVGLSKIDVIGLTQNPKEFREYGKKFFDKAMSEGDNFKLVLTHYPENFDGVIEEYPIDLAICGHAHGGLVRLPVIGGMYAADQGLLPALCDGYHEIENSKIIITRGLGRSGIVPRINNAPEISIVDINWY
ncbi:MAG: metallophosphoesterase [Clostridia bacterium]|nr:metallophosphoesterase [Clostridia bacterium]